MNLGKSFDVVAVDTSTNDMHGGSIWRWRHANHSQNIYRHDVFPQTSGNTSELQVRRQNNVGRIDHESRGFAEPTWAG